MYYPVYGLLYLFSLLPMPLLYLVADTAAFFLNHIIKYRQAIIVNNLLIAFPEKTDAERKQIMNAFYRNFCDSFIETLKMLSAGKQFIQDHFVIDNPELYEQYHAAGRKGQMHLGHIFNWELANMAMPLQTAYTFIVIYMPLSSKLFNRLFIHLRSRTGTVLLSALKTRKEILAYRNKSYLLTLVADQAPGAPENAYWLNFFGKATPFVRSPERGARTGNIPVFFARIYKVKRGYYRATISLASDQPTTLPEGTLTRQYVSFMEKNIRMEPAAYLWSHNRWKYSWKEDYKKSWIGAD